MQRLAEGGRPMSRSVVVAWRETAEELERRYRSERDVEKRKRLGALWQVRCERRVAEAGRLAGVGERTVFRWLEWYRAAGLGGGDVRGAVPAGRALERAAPPGGAPEGAAPDCGEGGPGGAGGLAPGGMTAALVGAG